MSRCAGKTSGLQGCQKLNRRDRRERHATCGGPPWASPCPAASTSATTPAWMTGGSVGQAAITRARSGSVGARSTSRAPGAAHSVARWGETGVFPERFGGSSIPAAYTFKPFSQNDLRKIEESISALGQRNSGAETQSLTPSVTELDGIPPAVQRIAQSWPGLPLYIREAILSLVDAALIQQQLVSSAL